MVRILGFHCNGPGSIPGVGTEIPFHKLHRAADKNKQTNKICAVVMYFCGSSSSF